jgi:hypothetical protein
VILERGWRSHGCSIGLKAHTVLTQVCVNIEYLRILITCMIGMVYGHSKSNAAGSHARSHGVIQPAELAITAKNFLFRASVWALPLDEAGRIQKRKCHMRHVQGQESLVSTPKLPRHNAFHNTIRALLDGCLPTWTNTRTAAAAAAFNVICPVTCGVVK